jgi:hypothetical protein
VSRSDAPVQRKFLYIFECYMGVFQMLQICVHLATNTRTRCFNDSEFCANVASMLQMFSRPITNDILPSCIRVLTFIRGFVAYSFFVAYAFTKCCHDLLDVFNAPWKKTCDGVSTTHPRINQGRPFRRQKMKKIYNLPAHT